jgi:hypothetical protein
MTGWWEEVVQVERGDQGGVVVIDMGGVIYGWHRVEDGESVRTVGEAINASCKLYRRVSAHLPMFPQRLRMRLRKHLLKKGPRKKTHLQNH